MYFNNVSDFIEMGGHGFFVWFSYAAFFGLLVFYYVYSMRNENTQKKKLKKFYRQMESRIQNSKKDDNLSLEEEN